MALKIVCELKIQSHMQKRYWKPQTVVDVEQRPNHIRHLDNLNEVWQTDITYIQLTNNRWVYLAKVLDPEKEKILGCKIDDTIVAQLATNALQLAPDQHHKLLIIHQDMGSKYTSVKFNTKWSEL